MVEFTKIDSFTSITHNVVIGPGEHDYMRVTNHEFLFSPYHKVVRKNEEYYDPFNKKLKIGNDVWVGCNCVILREVSIGDGAVIGAGTIVTKDVPDFSIVVGVPGKILKYRFSKKIIKELKK